MTRHKDFCCNLSIYAMNCTARKLLTTVFSISCLTVALAGAQEGSDEEGKQQELENSLSNTPFLIAVWKNDRNEIYRLVNKGADPNQTTGEGYGAIHVAIFSGNIDLILDLISLGTYVDLLDEEGNTPVHIAAMMGSREGIRALHKYKADFDTINKSGYSPFEMALLNENHYVSEYISGIDNNLGTVREEGVTPIIRLVLSGISIESWNILSEQLKEEDVNSPDSAGRTPLHHAAAHGRPDVISHLIAAGALTDVLDNEGNGPIHIAVRADSSHTIKALVEGGANPNLRDASGDTPLFTAITLGTQQAHQALSEIGAVAR